MQRWIAASLVFAMLEHLAGGMVVLAVMMDAERRSDRIGILVMSGVCSLVAVVAALVILQRKLLSPWLLVVFAAPLIGAAIIFW